MVHRPVRRFLTSLACVGVLAGASPTPALGEASEPGALTPTGTEGAGPSFQPDAWIKLCGLSTGCKIDPPPHPWLGKDRYNETGHKQTVAVDINEGEGVRFWAAVENDGSETDTLTVQGCQGTQHFELNAVLLGKHKEPSAGAVNVTRKYKRGTLTFDLEPGERALFTINIITHTVKGVTYQCFTTVRSANDPESVDVVIGEMTTY